MICDRATTGGVLGLLSYLALLLLPFWGIWRYYGKEYQERAEIKDNLPRRYLTPIIFSILILAYIIQNMFIFEALATYIPLIMVLSFVGLYSQKWDLEFWDLKSTKAVTAVVGGVFVIIAIPFFNLIPLYANIDFIKALSSQTTNLNDKIDAFEEVLSRETLGNQEYRRHYFNFYEQVAMDYLSNSGSRSQENDQRLANFSAKMENQFNTQLSENPYSVTNYLLALRFYNLSYFFDVNRLQKAVAISDKAISLSPGRPQVYYEVATTYYYLGNYYISVKDEVKAKEQFRLAVDNFYTGASKDLLNSQSFDEFSQFISSVSRNQGNDLFARALIESPINGNNITDLTAKMLEWLSYPMDSDTADIIAGRKDKMKSILEWLLKADPKNKILQSQFDSIK
jgi:tetratricopeptide (TPR) repeat protein